VTRSRRLFANSLRGPDGRSSAAVPSGTLEGRVRSDVARCGSSAAGRWGPVAQFPAPLKERFALFIGRGGL
jgi:hypothetical protein